jgi:hypothetical protein
MNPGKTPTLKRSVWIRNFIIGIVLEGSTIIEKKRYGVKTSPLTGGRGT